MVAFGFADQFARASAVVMRWWCPAPKIDRFFSRVALEPRLLLDLLQSHLWMQAQNRPPPGLLVVTQDGSVGDHPIWPDPGRRKWILADEDQLNPASRWAFDRRVATRRPEHCQCADVLILRRLPCHLVGRPDSGHRPLVLQADHVPLPSGRC